MNIFADECVFGPTINYLRALGHDVVTVYDVDLNGHEDPELLASATAEKRVLLTIDLDFSNIRHYPPRHHNGVIILRVRPSTLKATHAVLKEFLEAVEYQNLEQTLVIIDHKKVRTRRS